MWKWDEYNGYLKQISEIASKADISPIEFADRRASSCSIPDSTAVCRSPKPSAGHLDLQSGRCRAGASAFAECEPHHPVQQRRLTVVEGERVTANRGDLILTPNGTWHDHGNDFDEPVVWIDTLDWPLMEFLDAAWVDHNMPGAQGNTNVQAITVTDGYSRSLYGHGGKPTFVDHQRGVGHAPAPLFHYRGADVLEMLHGLRKEKGDPYEAIKVDFVNPVTGEPVFKTLNYSAQLLRPGEETEFNARPPALIMCASKAQGRAKSAASARVGPQRPVRRAEFHVAPAHQYRQDRRRYLFGVGRGADAQYRPVLRARPRQERQGDRVGAALSRRPSSHKSNRSAACPRSDF